MFLVGYVSRYLEAVVRINNCLWFFFNSKDWKKIPNFGIHNVGILNFGILTNVTFYFKMDHDDGTVMDILSQLEAI